MAQAQDLNTMTADDLVAQAQDRRGGGRLQFYQPHRARSRRHLRPPIRASICRALTSVLDRADCPAEGRGAGGHGECRCRLHLGCRSGDPRATCWLQVSSRLIYRRAWRICLDAGEKSPLLAQRLSTKVLMYAEDAYPNGAPVDSLWDMTKREEWKGRVVMVDPLQAR